MTEKVCLACMDINTKSGNLCDACKEYPYSPFRGMSRAESAVSGGLYLLLATSIVFILAKLALVATQ